MSTTIQISKKIKINNDTPLDIVQKLLDKFIERIKTVNSLKDNDRVAFNLVYEGDKRYSVGFTKVSMFDGNLIANRISKLLNSNESISIDGCSFVFEFIKQEEGGATHFIMTNINDEQIAKKKCLINIKNNDNSCFVIALGVSLAQLEKSKGNITEDKFKYTVKHCCRPK
jgi:hypothetical protein